MNKKDFLALALKNLWCRKSRTILTVFSVVIGITSIVVMLSLGFGLNRSFEQSMDSLINMNSIRVYDGRGEKGYSSNSSSIKNELTDKTVSEIQKIPHVSAVAPMKNILGSIKTNRKGEELTAQLYMVDFSAMNPEKETLAFGHIPGNQDQGVVLFTPGVRAQKWKKQGGDMFPEEIENFDFQERRYTLQIGDTGGIFDTENVFGAEKNYEKIPVQLAGKLEKSQLFGNPWEAYALVGIRDGKKYLEMSQKIQDKLQAQQDASTKVTDSVSKKKPSKLVYDYLLVIVDKVQNVEEVTHQLEGMDLQPQSNLESVQFLRKQATQIQLLLGGIGSIALFVAAIGITNTMLMSIQERKKEIGVMKVIGARVKDIRQMFLAEAMTIGVIGGVIGMLTSYGLSSLLNKVAVNMSTSYTDSSQAVSISYIPLWLPLAAILFAAAIGIIAGYLPARGATKLSAIDAIRMNS